MLSLASLVNSTLSQLNLLGNGQLLPECNINFLIESTYFMRILLVVWRSGVGVHTVM